MSAVPALTRIQISPAEQIKFWKQKRQNGFADSWCLPREMADSLASQVSKNDPLNRHEQAISECRGEIVSRSHLNVEVAIQRAFSKHRGYAWRAASEFMAHGVDSNGAEFREHRLELAKIGLTPEEGINLVIAQIKPLEQMVQGR